MTTETKIQPISIRTMLRKASFAKFGKLGTVHQNRVKSVYAKTGLLCHQLTMIIVLRAKNPELAYDPEDVDALERLERQCRRCFEFEVSCDCVPGELVTIQDDDETRIVRRMIFTDGIKLGGEIVGTIDEQKRVTVEHHCKVTRWQYGGDESLGYFVGTNAKGDRVAIVSRVD